MCFMKKKFLGFITFALVFSIGTYALVSFNNQAKVSELQLANIEALSDSEGAAIKNYVALIARIETDLFAFLLHHLA